MNLKSKSGYNAKEFSFSFSGDSSIRNLSALGQVFLSDSSEYLNGNV